MTQNRYYHPDPPPSEHAQAPPSAAHSNLPGDEGVWGAARASYVAGCSTPVVAERHGLNERTVRRRAAEEDWRGLRQARLREMLGPPLFAGEPKTAEEELARRPELELFAAAHTYEVGQLLMNPQPERLSRFAFRRSAEAAARGAPPRPCPGCGWCRPCTGSASASTSAPSARPTTSAPPTPPTCTASGRRGRGTKLGTMPRLRRRRTRRR